MKLFFREYGKGDPIIIVHGFLGMSDNWITVANHFKDEFKLYLPDLRNHGLSPHSEFHTFDTMSDDLEEFIADQNIDNPILIGHSMGGKTVLNFSLKHPDKVKKLIIVDISPREYQLNHFEHSGLVNHIELLDFMKNLNLSNYNAAHEVNSIIKRKFNNEFIINLLRKNMIKDDNKILRWKPNINVLRRSLSELSREIKTDQRVIDKKFLFIFGSKSPYFTPDDYHYITENFTRSEITIIKDAGHAVHVEKKDELVREIKQFIYNN